MRGLLVEGNAGSFNTYRGSLAYGDSLNSGIVFLASATLSDSKGHQELYYKEFDSPSTNNGLAKNVDAEGIKHLFGTLSWNGFTLQGAYSWRRKVIPTASFGTIFNDGGTYTLDELGLIDLKYERSVGAMSSLQSRFFFDDYNYHGDYRYEGTADSSSFSYVNKDMGKGEWLGTEWSYTTVLFGDHKLVAGTEYRANIRQDQLNYDEDPFYVNTDVRRKSANWAVYIQDQFPILKNLSVNAGCRFDHYSTFGGTTNPRGGLLFNPWEGTVLKALYGQAFRSPNDYELYYDESGAQKGNPSLQPERIRTAEIVVEQYIGEHHRVAASVFDSRITNLINQELDPEDGLMVFRNVERIASRGVGLELESRLPLGVHVLASYSWQQTEDLSNNIGLTNSPQNMAKVNINAPVSDERIRLACEAQYMSGRKTLQGNWTDPFIVTNVTVSSQRLIDPLGFSISVYNIFDTIYSDPGAEEHVQDTIRQDGRAFRVQISLHL